MEKFSDKTDVNTKIALYEYGIIRNPKTNKCIICTNVHELDCSFGDVLSGIPKIKVDYIDFDEVKEALGDMGDGYFQFIGSDRETELENLDNDFLTFHIEALEAYDGRFRLFE